jgi:hypothetical protein
MTTVPGTAGGERPCRSQCDESPVLVTAGGRGAAPCAGSLAHEPCRERRKRERDGAAGVLRAEVSVQGWGRVWNAQGAWKG